MLCAVFLLLNTGCDGKSTSERVAEHDRTRVSWEQTMRLVAHEWSKGATPDAYASRTLKRAHDELDAEAKSLAKDSVPPSERRRLGVALIGARALADTLQSEVRGGDLAGAARAFERSPSPSADSLLRDARLR
jgi:hypothetical protein